MSYLGFWQLYKKNRHFGRQVIANILGRPETDEDIEIIFQKAYNVSTS